jgi:hypothetical protein
MVAASIALVLLVSGKSRKARADVHSIIEITLPDLSVIATIEQLRVLAEIGVRPVATEGKEEAHDPLSIDVIEPDHEDMPTKLGAAIAVRPGVVLTNDLSDFANNLSSFFSAHHLQATITSGVRSGDHQLDIIKEKIARAHMLRAFPNLENATVADVNIWTPAWQWLKSRRIPVNPPANFINGEGNEIGASLHTKGLAIDLIGGNLDALTRAIVRYANSPLSLGPLRITSLTRERDCVHVALAR